MNTPDYSDEVAGAEDELTTADMDALGIPQDDPPPLPSRSYIRWKPIAEAAEREVKFWKLVTVYLMIFWFLTLAAYATSVFVK